MVVMVEDPLSLTPLDRPNTPESFHMSDLEISSIDELSVNSSCSADTLHLTHETLVVHIGHNPGNLPQIIPRSISPVLPKWIASQHAQ